MGRHRLIDNFFVIALYIDFDKSHIIYHYKGLIYILIKRANEFCIRIGIKGHIDKGVKKIEILELISVFRLVSEVYSETIF